MFVALRLAGTRGIPSTLVVGCAGGILVLLMAGLFWFAHEQRLGPTTTYMPARVSTGGQVLPGHGT